MKYILAFVLILGVSGFCFAEQPKNESWYPGKILVVEPTLGVTKAAVSVAGAVTNSVVVKPVQGAWKFHKENQKIRQENQRLRQEKRQGKPVN